MKTSTLYFELYKIMTVCYNGAMDFRRNYNLYASFFALVKAGTMSDASQMLGYDSHASVSKNIKLLEAELGVRLFAPHARGVQPTAEATRLFAAIAPLFSQIDFITNERL